MLKTERLHLIPRGLEYFRSILKMDEQGQIDILGLTSDERLDIELERVRRLLVSDENSWKHWDMITFMDNKKIGSCGFHNIQKRHRRAELGYGLDRAYRKNGYMSEAVKAIIEFGFNDMDLNRIEAFIDPENLDSVHLVSKLNFKMEGLLRQHHFHDGKLYDSEVYAMLAGECILDGSYRIIES